MNQKEQRIYNLEKEAVDNLNAKGWRLVHTGKTTLPFDAQGISPRGRKCVIEMKFRNKYYDTKMLEYHKYKRMMSLESDILKFYHVIDPEGDYLYLLNDFKSTDKTVLYCPTHSLWNVDTKRNKDVFLLKEEEAVTRNILCH